MSLEASPTPAAVPSVHNEVAVKPKPKGVCCQNAMVGVQVFLGTRCEFKLISIK